MLKFFYMKEFFKRHWIIIALTSITILGCFIRLQFLSEPLRYDEAYTYRTYAMHPISFILTDYSLPNNHIFHSLLLHFTTAIFGNSEASVRLIAFLAGIGLIPLTYIVARRALRPEAALLASTFVAGANYLVFYSVNARGYTLSACFILGVIYFLSHETITKRHQIYAGICAGLSLVAVPTNLIFLIAIGLVTKSFTKLRTVAIITGSIALLGYGAIVQRSGFGILTQNNGIDKTPWHDISTLVTQLLHESARVAHMDLWMPLVACLIIMWIIGMWKGHVKTRTYGTIISISLLIFILMRIMPPVRVLVPLIPLYFISVAAGIDVLTAQYPRYQSWIFVGVGIGILSTSILRSTVATNSETGYFPEYRTIVDTAVSSIHSEDRVQVLEGDAPFDYYFFERHHMHYTAFTGTLWFFVPKTPQVLREYAGMLEQIHAKPTDPLFDFPSMAVYRIVLSPIVPNQNTR